MLTIPSPSVRAGRLEISCKHFRANGAICKSCVTQGILEAEMEATKVIIAMAVRTLRCKHFSYAANLISDLGGV